MKKSTGSGTGPYADRVAVAKSARQRDPRPERRVTCRTCNGAGEVSVPLAKWLSTDPDSRRDVCTDCNGAGQVFA